MNITGTGTVPGDAKLRLPGRECYNSITVKSDSP